MEYNLSEIPVDWPSHFHVLFVSKFYCIDSESVLRCITRRSELPELRKGKGLMAIGAFNHVHMAESIPWAAIGC